MLISVIVPVYKVEEYIYRCVDSILAQSFKDFELILVDDGSPDNCGKICDEYAQKDKRITVIHKENGGLSDARNTGIDWALKNSNSNWITFIDSDDWVHTDYLKNLYNAVKENNVDISVCGYVNTTCEDDLHTKNSEINTLLSTPEDFFINNNINAVVAWGKLYKKSLWNDIRYPYGKIHEDEFTTHKLLFKCPQIAFVDAVLYYYYTNSNGIMGKKWTPKRLEALDAIESRMLFFKDNGFEKAYQWNVNTLVMFYYGNYIKILNNNEIPNKKKYLNNIKKRFIKIFYQYKNESFIDQDKLEFVLNTFSPFRCKIYVYKKKLLKKQLK